jgi:hypothetical protein
MRVRGHGLFVVAPQRNCDVEDCGIVERTQIDMDEAERRAYAANEEFRIKNNSRQPRGLPRFTETGFKKVRANP